MKPLEITAAICIGAALSSVAVPFWLQKQEDAARMVSLQTIMRAGRALLAAEEEVGYLPEKDWEEYARAFGKNLVDPMAKKVNPTLEGTGWGRNMRTQLSQGIAKAEDPKETHTQDLPKDAVLLMASNEPWIYPQRDGNLPDTVENRDPRLRFGVTSPYFFADGSASLLTKQDGKKFLKLRTIPLSRTVAKAQAEETKRIKEEWDKKTSGQSIYSGYIALEKGEVSTPTVHSGENPVEISFEVYSKTPSAVTTTLHFLNAEEKEVNCDPIEPGVPAKTHVALQRNPPEKYWEEVKGTVGVGVGFNAEMGHAEKAKDAHYKKGTLMARTFDTSETVVHRTEGSWKTITRRPKKIPAGTQAIKLTISKTGKGDETIIRNIKVAIPD